MTEEERNAIMLASAKQNLESMAFVGLTEKQKVRSWCILCRQKIFNCMFLISQISQYVFEETFNLKFKSPFTQNSDTFSTVTMGKTTNEELEAIRRVNNLDIELYKFAERLLESRFQELKSRDPDFEEHYTYLGETKGKHFSWDEIEND